MWNKLQGKKWFTIGLSILLAILCWLYVDIVQAPDTRQTVRNIPVTFLGEDVLAEDGYMLVDNSATVTLTLSGARSVVSQLTRNNITVTVQLDGQINSGEGSYDLDYSISYPTGVSNYDVTVIDRSVSAITVEVVQNASVTLDITGKFTGSVADGCIFDESNFVVSPTTVDISGPRSVVDTVSSAVVILDKDDLASTWTGTLDVTLLDKNGDQVDSSALTLSVTQVTATLPISIVKELKLTVDFIERGGATVDDISYSISPPTITVTGTEEQLADLDSISLGTIDLSQIITSDNIAFDIVLPNGLTNASGITTATVTVSIVGLTTQVITTSNIQLINKPDTIDAVLITESLDVRIRGNAGLMALLTDADVVVTVDLANIDEAGYGTSTLPATVSVTGMSELGAVGEYKVVVSIQESGG